jgi:hypothetical protein
VDTGRRQELHAEGGYEVRPVDPVVSDGWHTVVFAKDQPEYNPLPAVRNSEGDVITDWEPSRDELVRLLLGGRVRLTVLTFGHPLQPVRLEVSC